MTYCFNILSVQFSSVKDINIVGQASCRIFYLAKLKLDVEGKPPFASPTPQARGPRFFLLSLYMNFTTLGALYKWSCTVFVLL